MGAEILLVYVREAHPIDSNWPDRTLDVKDPTTDEARRKIAGRCAEILKLDLPLAVDGIDDAVSLAYNGWPERLYVIRPDGKIHHKGGLGPFGFKPEETAKALDGLLKELEKADEDD